jgi:hypothetical protein
VGAAAIGSRSQSMLSSFPPSRRSAPSLLIYPPTGSQWRPRAGGLWGGFPDPAKLVCMAFAKNGLASSHARGTAGADCRMAAGAPPCGLP